MTSFPRVTAIIVTYNSRATIDAPLRELEDARASGRAACIVVDNDSSDGTAEHVEDAYPWVSLMRSGANIGFARACNLGIEAADSEYILLLNPDAALPGDALERLVQFMEENPRVGICGPAINEPSGSVQTTHDFPTPLRVMLKPVCPQWATRGQRSVMPGEAPSVTGWICGCILLLRMRMIEEIGLFDPRFFLYFEETDLCYRAHRAGWDIWTVGESVGEHVNAASANTTNGRMMWGCLSEHYFPSRFYYMIKHHGWLWAIAAETGEIACMLIRSVLERLRRRSYGFLSPRLRAPVLRLPRRVGAVKA